MSEYYINKDKGTIKMFDPEILTHNIRRVTKIPFELLKEFIFDVYCLSDNNKKVVYIKSKSVDINSYFIDKMCGNDVKITKIRSIYIWELKKFVSRQDAVLIDVHKIFGDFFDDGFLVPFNVRQVLNIDKSKSTGNMIKLRNKELNKLKKYSYEIKNDDESLKFFYDRMYAPYINKKFGSADDFIYLKKSLRKGELIFTKQNDEYVSGALCEIHNDTYYCQKNGVADEKYVKEGALLATYYFPILRAIELDKTIVDFGLSKPFLTDGVLWHKNLWGVRICEEEVKKRFIYLKNVLFEHPFIYLDNGKLKAAIFPEDDNYYIKAYADSGLEFNVIDR